MGSRRTAAALLAAAALFVGAMTEAPPAEAAIVERIVAVVGERPILLSELRLRARPHIYKLLERNPSPTQLAAAESELFRELLSRMIDERLEEQTASKANITVPPEEVDNAIRTLAAQQHVDPAILIAEARRQGNLSEQDYRDEIRRQVLEGKLIQLRVRSRVRVSEADARQIYNREIKKLAQEQTVDLRLLALAIPPSATQETAAARITLGEELSRRGNSGEDFCKLVHDYSDDPSTRDSCGSRGPVAMKQLSPELLAQVETLKPGEVSKPIVFRDQTGQAGVLLAQVSKTKLENATFEQVKEEMLNAAYMEATERQRKLWLQELRRGVYIDVRL
ncbi:MAG: SurA N-terminal domain-containing protein [Labilithrix sp.]|nr:SurA N-terminal domain-containing protein [Labilithrix sp.]MCW5818254.1 SurA N-terminal domain-containing protein [Labilithrix sp.]